MLGRAVGLSLLPLLLSWPTRLAWCAGNQDLQDAVISASEILPELTGAQADCPRGTNSTAGGEGGSDAELSSQLLLRFLVLGLLALVSSSLAVVYSIKLCLCRRRKSRRTHDCSAAGEPTYTAGELAHLASLCAPPGCLVRSAYQHQAQPIEQLALLASQRVYPAGCTACLLDADRAPPAYSEVLASSTNQPAACRQDGPRNLLVNVKLNLNKIQLLSAEDLVLLSRLIDVPIVAHERSLGNPMSTLEEELHEESLASP